MPELPEVQTVVNDLQSIIGDKIMDFSSLWPKALKSESKKNLSEKEFRKMVLGKKILAIKRHGKNIIIELSNKFSIIAHLRMTGQLVLSQKFKIESQKLAEEKYQKHKHHSFVFKKNRRLDFIDIRKFGTLQILPTEKIEQAFAKFGIDPFAKNFSLKTFENLFERKYAKTIKEFLMDQEIILGIGNIYASEILFDAKIDPARKASEITKDEKKLLYHSIGKILTKAIKLRGTSVSDYRDASGKRGGFQNELKVYKKFGKACQTCGTMIERSVLGGRSTFFCSKCQR